MNAYSGGGSAPSQPAPPTGPPSNTRLGVSAPVSLAPPTKVDLRLARELEECLHKNNLYESKAGKQLRETVRSYSHFISRYLQRCTALLVSVQPALGYVVPIALLSSCGHCFNQVLTCKAAFISSASLYVGAA